MELVDAKSLHSIANQTEILEPTQPHWQRGEGDKESSKQLKTGKNGKGG